MGVENSAVSLNSIPEIKIQIRMGRPHPVTTEGNQRAEKQLRLPSCFFLLYVYQHGQWTGNLFIKILAHNSLDEEIICKPKVFLCF